MIKLTSNIGNPLYVSPELIACVTTNEGGDTELDCNGDTYFVDNSPEEVARKVLEYKLAMVRYSAAMNNREYETGYAEATVFDRLAGLEESQ